MPQDRKDRTKEKQGKNSYETYSNVINNPSQITELLIAIAVMFGFPFMILFVIVLGIAFNNYMNNSVKCLPHQQVNVDKQTRFHE